MKKHIIFKLGHLILLMFSMPILAQNFIEDFGSGNDLISFPGGAMSDYQPIADNCPPSKLSYGQYIITANNGLPIQNSFCLNRIEGDLFNSGWHHTNIKDRSGLNNGRYLTTSGIDYSKIIYKKTVPVINGNQYEFSAFVANYLKYDSGCGNMIPTRVVFEIYNTNNTLIASHNSEDIFPSINTNNIWKKHSLKFTAITNMITIVIRPSKNISQCSESIAIDDVSFLTYNVIPEIPEIKITGNTNEITNGDITPSSVDYTEFSATEIDKISTRTFIIQNLGTANLNLGAISISGVNVANFTIISPTSAVVTPNQTTKITVAFSPTQIGVKNATLNVASDDSDENPYNFALQGVGLQKNINTNFTEDFGSGSDGALLSNASTEYNLNSGINKCPVSVDDNNGVYMLTTNKGNYAAGNNCTEPYNLKNGWYKVADHTNNLEGRFMLIDAGAEPKVFYSRVVDNLEAGKMYQFSSWIANLYNPAFYCGGEKPISVTLEVFDGNNLIASLNTKDYPDFKSYGQLICPNDDLDNLWQKVSLGFAATSSTLKIVMRNNGEGGCANDLGLDDISLTLDNGLSTADFNGINSISIYPNPTQGKINFTEKVDEVKVFDLSGRLVKSITVNTTEVDLSDLTNGVYVMQVNQGQKTFTTKVVKE